MALKITPAPSWDQRNFCLSSPAAKSWQISLGFAAGNSKHCSWPGLVCVFYGSHSFHRDHFLFVPLPVPSPGAELPPGHSSCLSCRAPAASAWVSPPVPFPRAGLAQESLGLFLCWKWLGWLKDFVQFLGCCDKKGSKGV